MGILGNDKELKETKNKETKNKDMKNEAKNKETKNKETKNKETENKETKNKEMKNKETENKETKNKETQNKDMKNRETKNTETKNKDIKNREMKNKENKSKETKNKVIKNKETKKEEKVIKSVKTKSDLKNNNNDAIDKAFEKRKKVIVDLMSDDLYVPMKEKEIAIILGIKSEDRHMLSVVLKALLSENKINITKRGKYSLGPGKTFTGVFSSTIKGFGFVSVEGEKEDFFVDKSNVFNAFHGDTVLIEPLPGKHGEHREAKIISVVERAFVNVTGTYSKGRNKGFGFVVTDNKYLSDVFVDSDDSMKAKEGDKVVVNILSYGGNGKKPEGKVIEILGKEGDKGVDVLAVIRSFGIPEVFSSDVMRETEKIKDFVTKEDTEGRIDFRDVTMVTIDGEDSKDLDDAVSLREENGLYILGVHIADVSNYVNEGTLLDKEALQRGNSVYFVDRVIPMLPVKLSNGICSLNAGEDRLAMSCVMYIDKKGNVTDYKICESLINVNRRMTYTSVNKIINEDEEEILKYPDVAQMLIDMKALSDILRKKRTERGSVDFDLPETKIEVDDKGFPISVKPYEANDATRLIEDFMLAANETVASHIYWQDKPFIYRVHETPDADKIESLSLLVKNFGYYLKGDPLDMHPKEIQKLINEFKDTAEEGLVTRLALRSMKQARYSHECLGHFGLACKEYCHFTSPIRRYPDLMIHRILKDEIHERLDEKKIKHYDYILDDICKKCSKTERRADEAERSVNKLKKAEFMTKHIGEEYDGFISGLTGYGIYVELPSTVEGMIRLSSLNDDYFEFDEKKMEVVGVSTDIKYMLGQAVRIRVADVDVHLSTIDFEMITE